MKHHSKMAQGRGNKRTHGRYNKNKINVGDTGREILENIDENNIVIQQFREYAAELDNKHDRFEKIVKLSRDITIESKRVIFLLHTIDKESRRDLVLADAKLRLDGVGKTLFKSIAHELSEQDPYQYLRAYRSGMEEFVEAVTFLQYLKDENALSRDELEQQLTYTSEKSKTEDKVIKVLIAPGEFVLGIADLTGELMRKCINNLAMGDIEGCFKTCDFVRNVYKGFLGCTSSCTKKLYTLKQSLAKMENVCYAIRVRGSEVPKHMLADTAIAPPEEYNADEDEGYQVY